MKLSTDGVMVLRFERDGLEAWKPSRVRAFRT